MNSIMKTEYIATANDSTKIRYVIWSGSSENKKTPSKRLVLVHSLAMVAEFWEATAIELGSDFEILAIDCRGHGASDKPQGPYSVELFANDLAAVLDHADWHTATVGGASMGGCVALTFAALYPDRTDGLALIDTTAWYGETAIADWEDRGQKAVTGGMASMTDFQKTRWFSDDFRAGNDAIVEQAIRVFVANDPAAYLETCRMLGRCNQSTALGKITVPCEIIVGEEDYATPVAMAEVTHGAIPGSNLTVIPKARHFTPLEIPDVIARILASMDIV
ncbi:alpha/beta hydrolase [Alphaproteobacteria bacterium]|jgi:3-oxoadipate enol-lactonase|nr:alpha/beta hydrolase [Alphaproteobacteria bacterium]MDA8649954.1 alpha/beta hydrolase [Alphaproteobacteria bacterium]MDA9054301.1 alpha/beta hydrolase [Alphaproteobacteria bacterium]MDC0336870.1 alpha/beta hydrolase [Alphaproteobacteria bacterium]